MSSNLELTDEQRSVISKVEKLLRLAGGTSNEAEAASATAKAMELLAAYNLDSTVVGEEGEESARTDETVKSGFYEWQRSINAAVAELNFCLSWSSPAWVKRPAKDAARAKVQAYVDPFRRTHRRIRQHRFVGKKVNVLMTQTMITYLTEAVERATRDALLAHLRHHGVEDPSLAGRIRGRWASSFREGAAESIVRRLHDKRWALLEEERRAAREAAARAAAAGTADTRNAVTLSSLRQSERDANLDHLYGAGYSAKCRADAAERQRKADEAQAKWDAWAKENPEEAAKLEAQSRKEQAKASRGGPGSRGGQGRSKDVDWSAFQAGRAAGDKVGLDTQVGGRSGKLLEARV